jgi:hypothetical protein
MGMHPIRIRDPKDRDEDHFLVREDDWEGPKISYIKQVPDLLRPAS